MKSVSIAVGAALLTTKLITGTLLGQTTGPPILTGAKADSTSPLRLEWSSDPTAIYAVYSTSNFIDWQVAVDNFPSQGTNTLWSDYGVEMGDQSISASTDSDSPCRFYRVAVQGYMSNASPITVTISNIPNGAILSGVTNVAASTSTTEDVLANYLYVDGALVGQPGAPLGDAFPIDTRYYPNGIHRLTVAYENDGDAGTTGADDPVIVRIQHGKAWTFRATLPDSLTVTNCGVAYPQGNSSYRQKYLWPVYRVTGFGRTGGQADTFSVLVPLQFQ